MRIPGGVVVTGPQLIEELRRCPDNVMSFIEAVDEVRSFNTLSIATLDDPPLTSCRILLAHIHLGTTWYMLATIMRSSGTISRGSYHW